MCSLVPLKVGTNHASLIFMNIIMSAMEKVELHGFSLLDDLSCIRSVHVMATVAGGRFGLLGNVHHNFVCNPDLRAMIHKHMVRMTYSAHAQTGEGRMQRRRQKQPGHNSSTANYRHDHLHMIKQDAFRTQPTYMC